MSRIKQGSLLAVVVLITSIAGYTLVPSTASAGWSPWSCGWAVLDYYVQGGDLDGNACARWDDSGFAWDVWGETWVATSYRIDTVVIGQDTCAAPSWTNQMSGNGTAYNDDYGTIDSAAYGYYQSCTPMQYHQYRRYYSGSRMRYSTSSWEGTYGYWYP